MAANPSGPIAHRLFWLTVGLAALAAAAVGVLLPLIPTTPFVILAAFAFMKSSQRLHDWLISSRVFGPMIVDWREYGAIGRTAKRVAIASMAAVFVLSLALQAPMWVLAVQAPVLALCMWYVGSRPLPPE
jgi:uncharacterized membrane protein YbaN (DUF454 family)